MACNSDFVQDIADQCAGAGEIAVKKMMGDYCVYCDGILFGLICDNNFYLKVTEPGKALLKEVILRPPYVGAKDYFYITDVDDRDYLVGLIKASLPWTCGRPPLHLPTPQCRRTKEKRSKPVRYTKVPTTIPSEAQGPEPLWL